jgi:hypothetical protein
MANLKKVQHLKSSEVDHIEDQGTEAPSKTSKFDVVSDVEKVGSLKFNMPAEFYDPDHTIAKVKIVNNSDELKVIEADELANLKGSDFRKLIEDSTDVKKVVIEQISINDAKRLSLLYNQDDDVSSDFESCVLAELNVKNPIVMLGEEGSLYLKNIEKNINANFLNIDRVKSIKNGELLNTMDQMNEDSDVIPVSNQNVSEDSNVFNLRSKEQVDTSLDSNTDLVVQKEKAVYKKQTLVRKTKKSKPNDFYYQATNHRDLFKVGNSYYEDVKNGVKSFCFTSVDAMEEQQKTVFGISAFFNYHSELNVTIVTETLEDTYYLKHIKDLKKNVKTVLDGELEFEYYSVDGIDIIELKEFRAAFNLIKDHTFAEFLEELLDFSDLILWDLPQVQLLDKEREMFFPITMIVESASIIVKSEENKMKDVEKMLEYYSKYNVNVKGLIYSSPPNKKKLGQDG